MATELLVFVLMRVTVGLRSFSNLDQSRFEKERNLGKQWVTS